MARAILVIAVLLLMPTGHRLAAEIHKSPKLTLYPLGLYDSITWQHRRCTSNPVCKPSDSIVAEGSYQSNGEYQLLADGKDFYWAWDRGAFAYLRTRGDFSMTARLKSSAVVDVGSWAFGSPSDVFAKWGVMVREKLNCTSRMVGLMWDEYWSTCRNGLEGGCTKGQYGASWFWRNQEGLVYSEKSCSPGMGLVDNSAPGASKLTDLYLRIERLQGRIHYKFKYGASGTWQSVNPVRRDGTPEPTIVLQSQELFVGLAAATGGACFECDAGKGCTKAHWRRKLSRMTFGDVEFEGEILNSTGVGAMSAREVPLRSGISAAGRTIILTHGIAERAVISLIDHRGRVVFSTGGAPARDRVVVPAALAHGCYVATARVNSMLVASAPVTISP